MIAPFALVTAGAAILMILYRALFLVDRLSATGADPHFAPSMLLALAPNYLDLALPLGFLIGVIVVVARFENDLELDAAAAAGIPVVRMVRPLVLFGLALMLLSLALRGYGDPYGRYQFRMLDRAAANFAKINITPNAVYQNSPSFALTFDKLADGGAMEDIRLWKKGADGNFTFYAAHTGEGRNPNSEGVMTVRMKNGKSAHYINTTGELQGIQFLEFDQLELQHNIQLQSATWPRGKDYKELFLHEALREMLSPSGRYRPAANSAEFWNRISRALVLPLLPLLFLPMAVATKSSERAGRAVFAAFLIALVHHTLNMTKNLAAAEQVAAAPAVLGIFSLFTIVCGLVFYLSRNLPSTTSISQLSIPSLLSSSQKRIPKFGGVKRKAKSRLIMRMAARKHLTWALTAMVVTTAYLVTTDLLDRGDDIVERGMTAADVGLYLALRLPRLALEAIPISVVASTIIVLLTMSRNNEIIALRSSGVSTLNLLSLFLPVIFLFSVSIFALNELTVPRAEHRLAIWWASFSPEKQKHVDQRQWMRAGNDLLYAASVSDTGNQMKDVWLFREFDVEASEVVSAESATSINQGWRFHNIRRWRKSNSDTQVDSLMQWDWSSSLSKADVAWIFSGAASISARDARSQLSRGVAAAMPYAWLETRIARTWIEPLAPLILTLLVFPIAFLRPRQSPWPVIGASVILTLTYIAFDKSLASFAAAGRLPVFTGSLGASTIGLVVGGVLLTRLRR